jgi:hypothetical protein
MVKLMEQKTKTLTAEDMGINPPAEARATAVLNNIGNGMMIGGALPFARSLYDLVTNRTVSHEVQVSRGKWGLVFAGAGALIGAVLGEVEGRRLQVYRHKVSNKMADQENRIAVLEARSSSNWAAREDAREKTLESADITR